MLDIALCLHGHLSADRDAGKVKIGADARIVLDAYPDRADPGQGVLHLAAGAVHAEDRSRPRASATS